MDLAPNETLPSWDEIPRLALLTPELLIKASVRIPHGGPSAYAPGIESLAVFLEKNYYPGILKELALRYLREIKPVLEEALPLDEATLTLFRDPRRYFPAQDKPATRAKIREYFLPVIEDKTERVKQAFYAFVECGLGNFFNSIFSARIAQNEELGLPYTTATLLVDLIGEFKKEAQTKTPSS